MKTIVFLIAACAAAACLSAQAQEQDQNQNQKQEQGPNRQLEHVLVTIPLHQSTMETAFPVDSLSGDALAREAAATLGDTLDGIPGVHNASFGPGVGQPVIRGLAGPRVMSLQNGTRSADVSSLSGDHAVAVEPLLADSIEVLRGPATLLYGGGAIGGVVNVVDGRVPTQLTDAPRLGLAWRYSGANEGQSGVFRAEHSIGNVALYADGLLRDADDLTVPDGAGSDDSDTLGNTSAEADSGTLGFSFHFDGGFFGFAANQLNSEYGLPEGSHAHGHEEDHDEEHDEDHGDEHDEHDEEHEDGHDVHDDDHDEEEGEENIRLDMEQTRYDAVLHLHEPLPGVEVLRAFTTYTDYEHVELEGSEIGTVYASESIEGRVELVHKAINDLHGVVGIQVSDTSFSALGEEAFVPETDIERAGIFLLEDWHGGDWQLEAGLRMDWDSLTPDATVAPSRDYSALSASLGVIYELNPAWHLSASLSRAERAPAAEELYSNVGNMGPDTWVTHAATGAIEIGNTDLDTERGVNLDLGATFHRGANSVSLAFYVNDFDRFINLENTGVEVDETPVRRYVQEGARFVGGELDAEIHLGEALGGTAFLELGVDVVRGELDDSGDVPRLPPVTGSMGLNWSSDNQYYYTRLVAASDQDRPGENEEPTDSWLRWDLGGEWRFSPADVPVTVSAGVRNIADEEIRLSTSWLREYAPEPGRSVELGIRLDL